MGEETARDQLITIVGTGKILFFQKKKNNTENPPRLTDSGDIHPFESWKRKEGLFWEELSGGPYGSKRMVKQINVVLGIGVCVHPYAW